MNDYLLAFVNIRCILSEMKKSSVVAFVLDSFVRWKRSLNLYLLSLYPS